MTAGTFTPQRSTRTSVPASAPVDIFGQLAFTVACAGTLLLLFFLARLALLVFNRELIEPIPAADLLEAFGNGLRFDLRAVVIICAPLLLSLLSVRAMAARRVQRYWLSVCASVAILLGLVELNFYREFHQRLNSLVFQYLQEDPATVFSMLWHGFPVLRLLSAWALGSGLWFLLFLWLDQSTRSGGRFAPAPFGHQPALALRWRLLALLVCIPLTVLAGRGTLRQGPPLRWGDAFTTEWKFANQLGLNGAVTLSDALRYRASRQSDNIWRPTLEPAQALQTTREMLLTGSDKLVDADAASVRRDYRAPADGVLPVENVVVILMESFAGRYVGALGSSDGITPNFDRLAREGLLFRRFFSNGTHTHQGMFATMACFPNLPGFEYLMQSPQGGNRFSGLPQLLSARAFDDLYIYNGDFAWDNQAGFFSNQGMTRFIGRDDYRQPVVSDPTWGVSDQDMFDRAIQELRKLEHNRPHYAFLQTLSNHTPYALPNPLPVTTVTGHGSLDEHLTAMRYSDWALGRFFEAARQLPEFSKTLFVIVGDHGFGVKEQVTEMDLFRFNVPLLMIAPGITDKFGGSRDTVGTQVDIVPTIMGRLGGETRHQCWGRDLLALDASDPGFGVIKPSGNDQTVAILHGDRVVVKPKGRDPSVYRYQLGRHPQSRKLEFTDTDWQLLRQLHAYVQTATDSLLANTAGAVGHPPHAKGLAATPPPVPILAAAKE